MLALLFTMGVPKLIGLLLNSDIELWADTDETFSRFFQECLGAPDLCALVKHSDDAATLEAMVYEKFEELKFRPVASDEGVLIDSSFLQTFIRPSLYRPVRWTLLAGALDGLLSGNLTQTLEFAGLILTDGGNAQNGNGVTDAPYGIHCSDKNMRRDSLDELLPGMHSQWETSRILGDFTVYLSTSCAQWQIEPKERYEAGFHNIKTKNPLLVIGNTLDPATPIRSAFNISAGFEDSVVLTQNGYGVSPCALPQANVARLTIDEQHCSSSQPSICTSRAIQQYFKDGTLPEPDTVCEVDVPTFIDVPFMKQWYDLLPELGYQPEPPTNSTRRAAALTI